MYMKTIMTLFVLSGVFSRSDSNELYIKKYIMNNFVHSNILMKTGLLDKIDYTNFLFKFNTSPSKHTLVFKTKYLTPSLYIRDLLIQEIKKDEDGYYTIILPTNKEKTGYENKHSIPSIYLLMLCKFSSNKMYIQEQDDDNDDVDFKNYINSVKIEQNTIDKIYNYKQNIHTYLKIHDKNWMTMDCVYGSKSLSPYTHSIFSKIYYDENIKLNSVCRAQGGINTYDIYKKMNIFNPNKNNLYENFVRCGGNKNRYNEYGSFDSDIETITYLQELLKKYDVQSTLQ